MAAQKARRGNATMVVMVFGTLLGFSALSIDVGLIRVAGTEIQVTLDAAALSAASVLDGTDAGITKARAVAIDIASQNNVLGSGVTLTSTSVELGAWDRVTAAYDPYDAGDDPALVNAIRIVHQPPSFDSGLGGVAFGVVGYTVQARSMAFRPRNAGPAGDSDCFLPLAVPDCHLASAPLGANPPPLKFTFNPTPTDSIAWGNPAANPNTAWIRSQLLDSCSSGVVSVGDLIQVNEGVHNAANQTIRDIINGISTDVWDPVYGPIPLRDGLTANLFPGNSEVTAGRWSYVLEGPVALVDGGPDCSAVSFTAGMPTTGIGWAVIFDVMSTGGDKNLWIQLDTVGLHTVNGTVDPDATGLNVLGQGDPILEQW
jgi:hypothetical protein